jgi:hypothetical protein
MENDNGELKVKITTRTTTVAKSQVKDFEFGYWDDEKEEWVSVSTQDERVIMAERLGCTPEMVEALQALFAWLQEAAFEDLCSLAVQINEAKEND